ncbi:MAG: hypothetical protein IJ849_06355 [Selenomonadaceae bacterium]|nr:hypothetical protein [Selenomonadaceae bacterium]
MQNKRSIYQNVFGVYKNYSIIIYGTGVIASDIVDALKDTYDLYAVMDQTRRHGEFNGIKIIDWDDMIEEGYVLIVAAASHHYLSIYQRIKYECEKRRILIIGAYGEIISTKAWAQFDMTPFHDYLKLNINDAKLAISEHDYISFDVFDTLLVRQVYEPADVFSIIEDEIIKERLEIADFAFLRGKIGLKKNNIYETYEQLQKETGISDTLKEHLLYLEIAIEKEVLLVREDVKILFNYAKSLGKEISIISDMYLPKELLAEILSLKGISGWNNIYVSCDYRCNKEDGLYQVYLESMNESDTSLFLHFGDNPQNDDRVPRDLGMHVFPLKSPKELLSISTLNSLFELTGSYSGRLLVGAVIARLFNSPFSVSEQGGVPIIRKWETVGAAYFAIFVIIYYQQLFSYLKTHPVNGKILFTARDGYIFEKIYSIIRQWPKYKSLPLAVYLFISRRLVFDLCRNDTDLIGFLEHYYVLNNSDIKIWMQEQLAPAQNVMERRIQYRSYLQQIGLETDRNNIFFEVYSMGTVQHFSRSYLGDNLTGLYLMRYYKDIKFDDKIESVYTIDENFQKDYPFMRNVQLFEWCFSSPHPSIYAIDAMGKPLYYSDWRLPKDIMAMLAMQKGVHDVTIYFFKYCRDDDQLDKDIAPKIHSHLYESVFESETKSIFDKERFFKLLKFN